MLPEKLSEQPQGSDQIRNEFPFVRPRLRLSHFIPVYGAIEYIKALQQLKGESVAESLRGADLKDFLSLGVFTWPEPKTSKEVIEAGKTALQNGAFVAYHTIVTYTGVNEIVRLLFTTREKGA